MRRIAPWLVLGGLACGVSDKGGSPQSSRSEPVQFTNVDVVLRGSLTVPSTAGPHPAVVLLGGDGPWAGYADYFQTLTDAFLPQGFAVLRYDHRGDGASGGTYPVPFADLAGDALAAVRLVRGRSDIDARKVGIWGHSQGGWIGPLAASQSHDVAFVIMASGPALSPLETNLNRDANLYRDRGIPEDEIERITEIKRIVDSYYGTVSGYDQAKQALDKVRDQPWLAKASWPELTSTFTLYPPDFVQAHRDAFSFFESSIYDPVPALERLTVPVLALYGSEDRIVPVDRSIAVIREVLGRTGNADLTIRVFPGADHAIRVNTAPGGSFAPGYIEQMRDWLVAHAR